MTSRGNLSRFITLFIVPMITAHSLQAARPFIEGGDVGKGSADIGGEANLRHLYQIVKTLAVIWLVQRDGA
jgi:hypothetical protein